MAEMNTSRRVMMTTYCDGKRFGSMLPWHRLLCLHLILLRQILHYTHFHDPRSFLMHLQLR